MQDTDIISFCHWGRTLLPIPYLLADIITAETLYASFLFRPATYISLLFDTITLNILWLQRVPGMNISPSPSGALYLCDPASWCFSPQDNLKLPVPEPYGYTAVQWGGKKKNFRSGYPLQGEGILTSLEVTGGCIFHCVWVHAYVGRSSSLWGCHGSFSLTFTVQTAANRWSRCQQPQICSCTVWNAVISIDTLEETKYDQKIYFQKTRIYYRLKNEKERIKTNLELQYTKVERYSCCHACYGCQIITAIRKQPTVSSENVIWWRPSSCKSLFSSKWNPSRSNFWDITL